MSDLEQAARAELDRREEYAEQHGYPTFQDEPTAFLNGVAWLAERLLSDESVERVALALATYVTHGPVGRLAPGPNRDYFMAEAHAALSAVLGKEQ